METSYALHIVALSYVMAVIGSFTALQIATRIPSAKGMSLLGWLFAGGLALGGGAIWSMHFIGMTAYHTGMDISYDPIMTAVSLVIAVVVAMVGLVIVGKSNSKIIFLLLAGVAGGIGVCAMHYLGMAAMIVEAKTSYDYTIVGISVVIAIAAATAALWLAFNLRGNMQRFGSAFVMGIAVCGMHYTGMSALHLSHEAGVEAMKKHLEINPDITGYTIFLIGITVMLILNIINYLIAYDDSEEVELEL